MSRVFWGCHVDLVDDFRHWKFWLQQEPQKREYMYVHPSVSLRSCSLKKSLSSRELQRQAQNKQQGKSWNKHSRQQTSKHTSNQTSKHTSRQANKRLGVRGLSFWGIGVAAMPCRGLLISNFKITKKVALSGKLHFHLFCNYTPPLKRPKLLCFLRKLRNYSA